MYTHHPEDHKKNLEELEKYLLTQADSRYNMYGSALDKDKIEQAQRERQMYNNYQAWAQSVRYMIDNSKNK